MSEWVCVCVNYDVFRYLVVSMNMVGDVSKRESVWFCAAFVVRFVCAKRHCVAILKFYQGYPSTVIHTNTHAHAHTHAHMHEQIDTLVHIHSLLNMYTRTLT